jgi:hypothetical protein
MPVLIQGGHLFMKYLTKLKLCLFIILTTYSSSSIIVVWRNSRVALRKLVVRES